MKGSPQQTRRLPFGLVVLGLLGGALALLLALNTAAAADELRSHSLATADEQLNGQLESLRSQVVAAQAPAALANAAEQLGMRPVLNPSFLMVGADGAVTVAGSPVPVAAPPAPSPSPTPTPIPAVAPQPSESPVPGVDVASVPQIAVLSPTPGPTPTPGPSPTLTPAPTATVRSVPTDLQPIDGGAR